MSRINEARHIIWHKTCKCICRLSASVCNSRQRWNEDKCRYECKEFIDKGICDKGFRNQKFWSNLLNIGQISIHLYYLLH